MINYLKPNGSDKIIQNVQPFIRELAKRIDAIDNSSNYDDAEFKRIYNRSIATIELKLSIVPTMGVFCDTFIQPSVNGFSELIDLFTKHAIALFGVGSSLYQVDIEKPYLSNTVKFRSVFKDPDNGLHMRVFQLNVGMYSD